MYFLSYFIKCEKNIYEFSYFSVAVCLLEFFCVYLGPLLDLWLVYIDILEVKHKLKKKEEELRMKIVL